MTSSSFRTPSPHASRPCAAFSMHVVPMAVVQQAEIGTFCLRGTHGAERVTLVRCRSKCAAAQRCKQRSCHQCLVSQAVLIKALVAPRGCADADPSGFSSLGSREFGRSLGGGYAPISLPSLRRFGVRLQMAVAGGVGFPLHRYFYGMTRKQ